MQSPKCLFSASAALHRVFIHSFESNNTSIARSLLLPPRTRQISIISQQSRSYEVNRRLPRDSEIRNNCVHIVDEDGVFHNEEPARRVLQNIDLRTHHLVAVTQPPDDWKQPAICKIISNIELMQREAQEKIQAKEAKKKIPEKVVKTLEMNWAIDNNDLGHRIERIKDFLGRGNKVEILISPKRKGRKADINEANELVHRLRDVVIGEEGISLGWREQKAQEGLVNGKLTLFFEGKVSTEALAKETLDKKKVVADEIKSLREKLEAKEREISRRQEEKRDKWKRKERGEVVEEFVPFPTQRHARRRY